MGKEYSDGGLGPRYFLLARYAWAIGLGWSLLIGALFFIGFRHAQEHVFSYAENDARAALAKDLSYRKWASGHGGVYVPVTKETPPNPYLKDIPERDIITPSGRRLTLMNPAYMTRQVHESAAGLYGLTGHITSLKPLRPENGPDEWEAAALRSFELGGKEYSGELTVGGKRHMRVMIPFIAEKPCLKCHASQGYKEGEIRGGISASAPMAPYLAVANDHKRYLTAAYGLLWVSGLLGLGFVLRLQRTRMAELAAAQAALREQKKEMGEFLYIASHDLRTPLLNLQGYGEILKKELEGLHEAAPDKTRKNAREAFAFIDESVKSMDRILNSLLKISRQGMLEMRPAAQDTDALLKRIVDTLSFQLEEIGGSIKCVPLPACIADPEVLWHIFTNLLANAIKYRDKNRKLIITVSGEAGPGGTVCYSVADNGCGIPEKDLPRIWRPFYSGAHPGVKKGEGIGLTLVKKMVEANSGRVWVESREGEGSTFFVELPAAV